MSERNRFSRAAVIEPHVMQRNRVAELLGDNGEIEVVYTAATLGELLFWLQQQDHSRWPHLLVVDPESRRSVDTDLAALAALRRAGMRLLLLSSLASSRLARRLATAEVDAIVSKFDDEDEFRKAVRMIRLGGSFVTDLAAAVLAERPLRPQLSDQESRVLEIYASGKTIVETALMLGVREDTARKYLARAKRKFAMIGRPVRTKLELARAAWEDGLLTLPNPSGPSLTAQNLN